MSFLYGNICSWFSIILIVLLIILSIIKKLEKTKLAINIMLFIYGLLCSITYPSYLLIRLSKSPRTDKEFINWASIKFYNCISILAIITIITLTITLVVLIFNKKHKAKWLKIIMIFAQICLIILALMLSFNTINKIFDIAIFILGMGYYNALILFVILPLENLIRKKSNTIHDNLPS